MLLALVVAPFSSPLAASAEEPAPPPFTVADSSIEEPDSGSATLDFVVQLSSARSRPVDILYATADGTATAPADYTATSGSATVPAGSLSTTVSVPVLGDLRDEGDESFVLTARMSDGTRTSPEVSATGTIRDNDRPATLTVTKSGDGLGRVTSSPAGIDCGLDCNQTYLKGTQVSLTATAARGSSFAGWSGACSGTRACTVTMDQARSVKATFVNALLPTRELSIYLDGARRPADDPNVLMPDRANGQVVSTPAGIDCTLVVGELNPAATYQEGCSASYDVNSLVTLEATPRKVLKFAGSQGYVSSTEESVFLGWNAPCAGTGTCTVTMDQARSVTARFGFLPRHDLTVAVENAHRPEKSQYTSGTVTSSPAGIDCRGANNPTYPGSGGYQCEAEFVEGTTVTLTAVPGPLIVSSFGWSFPSSTENSVFTGWSGACEGPGTCTVSMDEARNVTAHFGFPVYRELSVALDFDSRTDPVVGDELASGSVASSPAGIDCRYSPMGSGPSCTAAFLDQTVVTLTATPGQVGGFSPSYSNEPPEQSVFTGWSGACTGTGPCTVTMDQARNVTASFGFAPRHELVVELENTSSPAPNGDLRFSSGKVTSSPAGIDCGDRPSPWEDGPTCTSTYVEGTLVTLTAAPGPALIQLMGTYLPTPEQSVFLGWGGACSGITTTCTVTLDQARDVTARFGLSPYHGLTVDLENAERPGLEGAAEHTTGRVTSSPAGIDCGHQYMFGDGPRCSASFVDGTTVTLTATPGPVWFEYLGMPVSTGEQSVFLGWRGPCERVVGASANTCTVLMSQARHVTAIFGFAEMHDLSVVVDNDYRFSGGYGPDTSSGTVTSSPVGVTCGEAAYDCSESFPEGTVVTLTAAPGPVYAVDGFFYGPTEEQSVFLGWSGACTGAADTCTVTMDQARDVTAIFGFAEMHDLSVVVDNDYRFSGGYGPDTSSGTVTSSPVGVTCGEAAYDCSESFPEGTVVTLTAAPGPVYAVDGFFYGPTEEQSVFLGWSGACSGTATTCAVTMDQARNVTAEFGFAETRNLSVDVVAETRDSGSPLAPDQSTGSVTSSPAGVSCGNTPGFGAAGPDCSESFVEGTRVTLTATPGPVQVLDGYYKPTSEQSVFLGWEGECNGTSTTCTVTMNRIQHVTARFGFAPQSALVVDVQGDTRSESAAFPDRVATGQVTSNPTGIDCRNEPSGFPDGPSCEQSYLSGATVTLTATPGPVYALTGYFQPTSEQSIFLGWSGACSGTAKTCTVTMSQARSVAARFGFPP